MIVKVNGREVVKTSSSKLIPVNSKDEALMFQAAYVKLGFENVTIEAEYKGPQSVKEKEVEIE